MYHIRGPFITYQNNIYYLSRIIKKSSVLNVLSMKWQWAYGPTLLPWNNHFRTYKAGLELLKVVLEGYRRCPDSHDLSECHHLHELGRHIQPLLAAKNLLPTTSLTVLTLTLKRYLEQPSRTTLNSVHC